MASREAIMTAILAVVTNAYPWTTPPSRRLKLWTDVPADQRPTCFQFEGDSEDWKWTNKTIPVVVIPVRLFAYTDCKDQSIVGATQLNNIIDGLQAAFTPTGVDLAQGRFTLGGLVNVCRISGKVFKDPGDIDGDGMLIANIEIEIPSF
jgi:hypothetical protein